MQPPTDRFPKFVAIAGLAILLWYFNSALTEAHELQVARSQTEKELAREKAHYEIKSENFASLRREISKIRAQNSISAEQNARADRLEAQIISEMTQHTEEGRYIQKYEDGLRERSESFIADYDLSACRNIAVLAVSCLLLAYGVLKWIDIERDESKQNQNDLIRREKAARIVDLFVQLDGMRKAPQDDQKRNELRRTLWELCLYLDKDSICKMSEILTKNGSLTELFVYVRQYIFKKDDGLIADNIPVVPDPAT